MADWFDVKNLNANAVEAQYAVRGAIVARAAQIDGELKQAKPFPFTKTVPCNIGNPQAVGQKAPQAIRQTLGMVVAPSLVDSLDQSRIDPAVMQRAREITEKCGGSIGAYTASRGFQWVLDDCAAFVHQRDGIPCDTKELFTSDGASNGIKLVMNLCLRSGVDSCLVPIPQYPLYSAALSILGVELAGYYLNEAQDWALDMQELERAANEAKVTPRMLVIINPGNPTGALLSEKNMKDVVAFAHRRKLVLIADEVYQENVYTEGAKFISFRKVVLESGLPVPLASFHSTSKGLIGECGARGGFYQLTNFPPAVAEQAEKLQSIGLCPNVPGQVLTALMVRPPASQAHKQHVDGIMASLKRRAKMLYEGINQIPGVSTRVVAGSMYSFVNITGIISAAAKSQAATKGVQPDFLFCSELLEETGVVTVPGSGFKQAPGTWHLRMTILPQEEDFPTLIQNFAKFVAGFRARYPADNINVSDRQRSRL